jgi:hypothetical protein
MRKSELCQEVLGPLYTFDRLGPTGVHTRDLHDYVLQLVDNDAYGVQGLFS